jgi:tRNA(Arg) A34 adenosine deaminase TadA
MQRRLCLLLSLLPWWRDAAAAPPALLPALARAHALRDEAVRSGDQAYGAVVWRDGVIVGEAPSRVVVRNDRTAHAEREALRDAQRRLGRDDLSGCLLVSSSRPCAMCEDAAARAGISRMFYGEGVDAGPPHAR